MNRCNAIAMAIYGQMYDQRTVVKKNASDEIVGFALTSDMIKDILAMQGVTRLADWRIDEIGKDLAKALAEFHFEACGVSWFAHMLEHDIYDPNLKRQNHK